MKVSFVAGLGKFFGFQLDEANAAGGWAAQKFSYGEAIHKVEAD